MKTTRKWLFCLLALGFVLAGCGDLGEGKTVHPNLHGSWKSADPSSYSGTVVIDFDTIKITGYDQYSWLYDPNRPFDGFSKGSSLSCYTEGGGSSGSLFIQVFGGEQSVRYECHRDSYNRQDDELWFQFGGRTEVLIRMGGS